MGVTSKVKPNKRDHIASARQRTVLSDSFFAPSEHTYGGSHEGMPRARQRLTTSGTEDLVGHKPTVRKAGLLAQGQLSSALDLSQEAVLRNLKGQISQSQPLTQLQALIPTGQAVPVGDTSVFPWRAIAALVVNFPGTSQNFIATGWLVGPYCIVTAGHVVFARSITYTGFASQIRVLMGLNGWNSSPTSPPLISRRFASTQGWVQAGDPRCDYAMIALDQPVGNDMGWFGFSAAEDGEILATVANLSGYPAQSPDPAVPNGHQWYASGQPDHLDDSFIYYNLGAVAGESGGALYRNDTGQTIALGIHAGSQGVIGRAVRITPAVSTTLQSWRSYVPS
jgi:glutamyl endopeptidase